MSQGNKTVASGEGRQIFSRSIYHYQQKSNWDCGVACVLMALSDVDETTREEIIANCEEICKSEGFGHSTWTIDLCYLLKNYAPQVNFYYTTITIGVDPGYVSQVFYNRILHCDTQRVVDRFRNASNSDICVKEKNVHIDEIIHHIAHHGTCIVLTNANLLACDSCNYFTLCRSGYSAASNCLSLAYCNDSYQGHYVLAVGFDLTKRRIIYRNPTFRERECVMSFEKFDKARTSYGTDEDIIFMYGKP